MVQIKIYKKDATEITNIVREIRNRGWIIGKDFDFYYIKSQYDDQWKEIEPMHTLFKFYTEKYATIFALKYSS